MDLPFPMNPNPITEPSSTVKKTEESMGEKHDIESKDKMNKERLNEELINYEATYDKGHRIPPEKIPP